MEGRLMLCEEQIINFLNVESNDVKELKALLIERSEELLMLKQFIKDKGLFAEYQAKTTIAKAKALSEMNKG